MFKNVLKKIRAYLLGSILTIKEPEKIIEEIKKQEIVILSSQLKENTKAIYSLSNHVKDILLVQKELYELAIQNKTALECIQNEFDSSFEDENLNNDEEFYTVNTPASLTKKDMN